MVFSLSAPTFAQNDDAPADPDLPDLTEAFNGRGRLAGVDIPYPADWFTLGGVPVNRLVSMNVISSVRVGLLSRPEAGEEAIIIGFAGGRNNRWPGLEEGASATEVLMAFAEAFGQEPPTDEMQAATQLLTIDGREVAILLLSDFEVDEEELPEDADPDREGDFAVMSIVLDDERFLVGVVITSVLTYEDAEPILLAIIDGIEYEGDEES